MYVSDFSVSESRTCSVNMMYQETKFRYKHFPDDSVQLLEMPYRGDDITMVIILPSRGTPLSKVTMTTVTSSLFVISFNLINFSSPLMSRLRIIQHIRHSSSRDR